MSVDTDRELLELAAKASGIELAKLQWNGREWEPVPNSWNPLTDDEDALRLVVKLNLDISFDSIPDGVSVSVFGTWDEAPLQSVESFERDGSNAIRRAIVRAAAEIGRAM